MKFREFCDGFQPFKKFDSNLINGLIESVIPILKREPMVIEIAEGANSIFVGDTHGDLRTALSIIRIFLEESYRYIFFLGDYVDRGYGDMQVKLVNVLLYLKQQFPDRAFLLRGNHEWSYINAEYGFKDAIYNHLNPLLFQRYNELFNQLPIAVKVAQPSILAVHGGVPVSDNDSPHTLKELKRIPKKDCFENELVQQILWNDPSEKEANFCPNHRGLGYIFGQNQFLEFMNYNKLETCIRSHEVKKNGYEQSFEGRLLTIFSCKTYGKKITPHVLVVNETGAFEFREIRKKKKKK